MKFELLNHIMRFIVLSVVQIFVLNNIALFDFATPYLYLFFIIALPLKIPNWALLSVAFLSGLTIDVFTNTPGMHASACVTVAFIRPFLLEVISPREGYGSGNLPLIRSFGLQWFLTYSGILVVFHHVVLFMIELFRFSELHRLFGKALVSALFTILLMVIIQYFNQSKKSFE